MPPLIPEVYKQKKSMPLDQDRFSSRLVTLLRSKDLYLTIARYNLSFWLIPYAVSKILLTQFVLLPFDKWREPLEQLSGPNLAWAFLGYAPWFQISLGFLELIPAVLLLFRRTSLLGAILLLPIMLCVVSINYALDLWDTTKEISSLLLLANIFILLLEWKRIRRILEIVLCKESRFKYNMWEAGLNIVVLSVALYLIVPDLFEYIGQKNDLTGDWRSRHPYEWRLKSESLNSNVLAPRQFSCFFGPFGIYSEADPGSDMPGYASYSLNKSEDTLYMRRYNDEVVKLKYRVTDSELQIEKNVGKDSTLRQTYVKRIINSGNR